MVQLRRQMLERMKQREKMRHQLAGMAGQAESQAEKNNAITQKSIAMEKIESRNKVDIFENAFRKIKEATGVSDVNEVIQKIVSQESTTENLIAVTRENQAKIEALNELKKRTKQQCEELKYSGVGGGQHRKMVDSYEEQLANSATRLGTAVQHIYIWNSTYYALYTYIHTYILIYTLTCIFVYARKYIHIHTHIYKHTHIHTYIRTYIYSQNSVWSCKQCFFFVY